ncbi:MAG: lactonase family protein [Pirellulaceae bacterium]
MFAIVSRSCLLASSILLLSGVSMAESIQVYFGTYTQGTSRGIYRADLDLKSGSLSAAKLVAETTNPSFLALHPNGKWLYAVNETVEFEGEKSGAITGFLIDDSGNLHAINQHSTRGGAPCHLAISRNGQFVLIANYVGGNVISLRLDKSGKIVGQASLQQHEGSSQTARQKTPHAHSIGLDPSQKFAFAADLGLDQVVVYQFDAGSGKLKKHAVARVAPGSGPRHFLLHPKLPYAYVINEINSTLTSFGYDRATANLEPMQTVGTLPADFDGRNSTAELQITPDGRFLYGSNRGHHSLAMYAIDQETGRLRLLGHQSTLGKTPRNFNITPDGQFVLAANQESNTVAVFRIASDGRLKSIGEPVAVPKPVCVEFRP